MRGDLAFEEPLHFLGGGVGERLVGQLLRLAFGAAAQDLLDFGDRYGGHGEFVEAEAKQDGEIFGFAGHFAAHAGVDAGGVGGVDHHLERAEHGRVERFVQVGEVFIRTVDG